MQTPSLGRIVLVPSDAFREAPALITHVTQLDDGAFLLNVRVLADNDQVPEHRKSVLLHEEKPDLENGYGTHNAWWPPRV